MSSQQPQAQYQPVSSEQNLIQHWDSLSPLTDLEKQSIHSIQKATNDKPLPSSLSLRPQQLNNLNHQLSPPSSIRSNSPSSSLRRSTYHSKTYQFIPSEQRLHLPISTIDRFNDWFSTISSQIEADSESTYLNHLSLLSTYSDACDLLDQAIDDCRACLNEIEANWKFVNENSKSLERSCQGMLDDQKLLGSIATALSDRLAYFRRLEESQRVLSRPGEAEIVTSHEFLPMIERLDVCLEFMKSNRHFKDADLYLVRFQQCLTRSMTLIKLYYTNQMKHLSRQVQEKLQINQQYSSNLKIEETLLYAKFHTLSQEFRPLISQVEKRYLFDKDEYGALLSEFFSTWVSVRSQLLHARIKIEINRIQITHQQVPDLISLATTGCNYMRSVCTAEWNLFKSFFPETGEEELFVYLESLCDYLYDLLRPQILHEQKLDILCDLATISNALIAMDTNLIEADQSRFKFSTLLKPILQDIQTRLVFRAQAIIQVEVANYLPKNEDLDYPNKLIQADQKRQQSGKPKRSNNPSIALFDHPHVPLKSRLPAEAVQENWYPTLRKTLWVLSRLHTYVNEAIFEDFAGEAVGICSESIIKASNMMNSVMSQQASSTAPTMGSKIQANSIDRELFVIRHLLILKEMIRTLDVVQVERAVDLGPITDVLKEILNPSFKDSLIFKPITLMNKLKNLNHSQIEFSKRMRYSSHRDQDSLQADEHHLNLNLDLFDAQITKTIDSKSELDLKLKTICHQFIIKSSALICSNSIEPFLSKCQNHLNLEASMVPPSSSADPMDSRGEGGSSITLSRNLGHQEWASQDNVLAVSQSFLNDLQLGLNIIFNRVALYFHDDDHHDFNLINVLFPALQEEILEKYRRFYSLIKFEFDFSFINDDQDQPLSSKEPDDHSFDQPIQTRVLAPSQLHALIQKIVYRQSSSL